jgi:hypothetical protein
MAAYPVVSWYYPFVIRRFRDAAMAQKIASSETGGDLMSSRNLFASALMASLLTAGVVGLVPAVDAASAGQSALKRGKSASNHVIEIKHRGRRGPRLYLPIVPYIAYDYPYYYARGRYSKHIGPGYVYYGYPYRLRSSHYRRYRGR